MKSLLRRNVISLLLFFLVMGVGIILVPSIGPAWDEPDNIHSAGRYIEFFQKQFDPEVLFSPDWTVSYFGEKVYTQNAAITRYPPFPNYIGGAIALMFEAVGKPITAPLIVIAFHMATVLFLGLFVATVFNFSQILGMSKPVGVFAALAAFLYPTIFGHGFSNLKDTAQMSLFTVSLYLLVKGTLAYVRHDIVLGAIAWGLSLATKINAVFVPIIFILWLILIRKPFGSIVLNALIILGVGLVTAVFVWPVLWFDPLTNAGEVYRYFTTVGQGYGVFWNGVLYRAGQGGMWWYPWVNLFYTTPVVLTVAWATGLIFIRKKEHILLLLWFTVPLLRSVLPTVAFYDGIRHFMEVLPAFILLAALGISRLKRIGLILACIIIGQLVWINSSYFPYSTGYFNVFANNPNVRFDRDIEALSVREAVEYLHTAYGRVKVWVPIGGHLSWYYLLPGDSYVYNSEDADAIVIVNKSSHFSNAAFVQTVRDTHDLVHTVTRGDAIFAWVYRKKTNQGN